MTSLKARLAASEAREADQRRALQQLEADKAGSAAGQEQQRAQFDRCLDEIANHVVQALVSQKVFARFSCFEYFAASFGALARYGSPSSGRADNPVVDAGSIFQVGN